MSDYHSFSVELAILHGLEKAIILQHITFWLKKNKAHDEHFFIYENENSEYDGKEFYFTYFTVSGLAKLFPYLGTEKGREQKIYRLLSQLENDGILISCQLNQNKWNKVKSYSMPRFNRIIKNETSNFQNSNIELSKMKHRTIKNETSLGSNNKDIIKDKRIYIDNFDFMQKEIKEKYCGDLQGSIDEFKLYGSFKAKSFTNNEWITKLSKWFDASYKVNIITKPVKNILDNVKIYDEPRPAYEMYEQMRGKG